VAVGASSLPDPTAVCSRFRPQTTTTFRSRALLEPIQGERGYEMAAPRGKTTKRKRGPGTGAGGKKKICHFCKDKVEEVDYKNVNTLRRYVSEKGKIRSRRITGACRRHQRQVAVAVKRAREVALLPYVAG
jgi:small subunit ribosomal protein S18